MKADILIMAWCIWVNFLSCFPFYGTMLSGSLVTTTWHVLTLQMEETWLLQWRVSSNVMN